jgi:hypothetical protein
MWSGEEDLNLRSHGSGPRAVDLTGPSPDGTLARTRTSTTPINSRLPYLFGHKGVVPEARTRTCTLLGVSQALFL